MLFLRSLFYFIGSIISLVVIAFFSLFFYFAAYPARYRILSKWAQFCMWWLRVTVKVTIKVEGGENICKEPCVIVSNHQSTWETLAFQTVFPAHTWVLKKELLSIPVFGWNLAMLSPIVIKRSDKFRAMKQVIKQGSDRLRGGISVVIFPEGTRQPHKKLGKYQNGAVAIAKISGRPLQPVFHNAGKCWPKGGFLKKPGVITIVVGEPIFANDGSVNEITEKIKEWTVEQSQRIDN
ncbi:MAG: 1-acyl-sn-glycerol-3-phosphate acyltransferase [Gammaproteobacteria bacterium]|nr:1-acyl-sn-glycerol-3-phosphate acyltransferase [Gammaproteobacteria bacterium]